MSQIPDTVETQNIGENVANELLPTKEEVLKALDFEISLISSEQQRNGWTRWALYGVSAACLWLLLEQWDKSRLDFNVVLILILVFSIALDILRQSRRLLPVRPKTYEGILRFKPLTETTDSAALFLHLFRHPIVFTIGILFVNKVSIFSVIFVLFYYGLYSLTALIAFPMLYFPQNEVIHKTVSKMEKKWYYLTWSLTIAGLIWGLIGYLNAVFTYYPQGLTAANFRIAGLVTVIGYTFFLLLNLNEKVPLLNRLIEIRRDLSFGRIDVKSALKQAEIIIAGIPVNEKLQNEVAEINQLLEKRNKEFNNLYKKITNLSKRLPKNVADITPADKKKAKEVLFPCIQKLNSTLQTDDEKERLLKKLRLRIIQVERESPNLAKSTKEFLEKIENQETEMGKKAEQLFEDVVPLVDKLKLSDSNEKPSP